MSEVSLKKELRDDVVQAKDFHDRSFSDLTSNFYLVKSALRYYSVKKGMSITSTRISEDFPLPVTVAGSCLTVLEEMGVVERRSESGSSGRYLPETVDLERLEKIQSILIESREIEEFTG